MRRDYWSLARRARLVLLLLAMAIVSFEVTIPVEAFAQERVVKPWSLRNLLFFRRKEPRLQQDEVAPKEKSRAKSKQRKARQTSEPKVVVVDKVPDAKIILVVGDFVAAGAAEGLNAVFAGNPRVKIIDRTNGSSGLARSDYFDWPSRITELVEAEKPSVIIFSVGANDRQQIRVDGTRSAVRSEPWTAAYTARVTSFLTAAYATKVPLVWVGAPAFKSPKMNSDMLAFNEIFRGVTAEARGEFVDVWDGFVDETGAFVTTGPDINGQPVRLRAGDGINFTMAGKRKLAFYTEKSLKKILGETGTTESATLPSAALPGQSGISGDPSKIERTVPVSLNDPVLDGGTELMGLQVVPNSASRQPASASETAAQSAPGRADDFAWPPRSDTPTAAILSATTELAAPR